MKCPCGSGVDLAVCCVAYIHRAEPIPTAEALMRFRYSAYVLRAIDYLIETHDPVTRGEIDRQGLEAWSRAVEWRGLAVERVEHLGRALDVLSRNPRVAPFSAPRS